MIETVPLAVVPVPVLVPPCQIWREE